MYKKGDHQCVKKYRPVSVLPVFRKIFERLIYNATCCSVQATPFWGLTLGLLSKSTFSRLKVA